MFQAVASVVVWLEKVLHWSVCCLYTGTATPILHMRKLGCRVHVIHSRLSHRFLGGGTSNSEPAQISLCLMRFLWYMDSGFKWKVEFNVKKYFSSPGGTCKILKHIWSWVAFHCLISLKVFEMVECFLN